MSEQFVWSEAALRYVGPNNKVIQREYGKTPNGNSFGGSWVLRNAAGELLDFDMYRNDLIDRHRIKPLE